MHQRVNILDENSVRVELVERSRSQIRVGKDHTQIVVIGIQAKEFLVLLHLIQIGLEERFDIGIILVQKSVVYQRIILSMHIVPVIFNVKGSKIRQYGIVIGMTAITVANHRRYIINAVIFIKHCQSVADGSGAACCMRRR